MLELKMFPDQQGVFVLCGENSWDFVLISQHTDKGTGALLGGDLLSGVP